MKAKAIKPDIVYRVINRKTGEPQGSYSRAYCDEYDFESPEKARHANCYGIYTNRQLFRIAQYRVTYELLEDEAD